MVVSGGLPADFQGILRALEARKYGFSIGKSHFFEMLLFGFFELFRARPGASRLLLGPSWAKIELQRGAQNCFKVVLEEVPKRTPKLSHFWLILGPNSGPKTAGPDSLFSYFFGSGGAWAEDGLKMAPRRPKMTSRWPQDGPRWPQDGSKKPKTAPRWPQDSPR